MSDVLLVRLHGQDVGEIVRFDNGRIQFEFFEGYASRRERPTLSQSFLDERGDITNGGKHTISGRVPVFFSNLLPEGRLRTYLAAKAGVRETREFELLELLGGDLPGAVEVVREDRADQRRPTSPSSPSRVDGPPDVLRFSLAGVQLKFSAIEKASGGLTIPARGMGGDWILKLPSFHHDAVPENEYSMMVLAKEVGIEVPDVKLVPMRRVEGLPAEVLDARVADEDAFAVRRFDRTADGKVHAEDFAQVTGLWPNNKYDQYSYATIALLLASFASDRDVDQFSRRLMYAALVGNGDLHMKNWSLIYRDGKNPEMSPAYDLLCTAAYMPNDDMALRLGSARRWRDLTLDDFAAIADGAHVDPDLFVNAAVETSERFREIWPEASKALPIPDVVRTTVETQLATVPAITGSPRPRGRRSPAG